MSSKFIRYKRLVHFSQDITPFPIPVGCGICLCRSGRGHGKTKLFKHSRSKYFHIRTKHKSHLDEGTHTVQEELDELEALSKMVQRGIFK